MLLAASVVFTYYTTWAILLVSVLILLDTNLPLMIHLHSAIL